MFYLWRLGSVFMIGELVRSLSSPLMVILEILS